MELKTSLVMLKIKCKDLKLRRVELKLWRVELKLWALAPTIKSLSWDHKLPWQDKCESYKSSLQLWS